MKILFLDSGFDEMNEILRKERKKYKCDSVCLYKYEKRNMIFKLVQFIGIYFFSPILYLIYGEWKKRINDYDLIIIPSRKSAKYAINIIKKRKKRLIVWYWNIVTNKELDPEYCRNKGCETWTFDKYESEKYGMKFGDTYYFPNIKKNDLKKELCLFYVGINRPGREELLNSLKEVLEKNNLSYKFVLTAFPNASKKEKEKYDKRLEYHEVLEYINKSDAILDLNRDNQTGLTIRPVEALFFHKKLITNNKNIKKYKIYENKNIFILDNDIEELLHFLKEKNYEFPEKLIDYYSFESWLKRICNNEEGE